MSKKECSGPETKTEFNKKELQRQKNQERSTELTVIGLLANCQDVKARQRITREKRVNKKYNYHLTTCVARSEHTSRTQHNFKKENISEILQVCSQRESLLEIT
jgi:DNA-binding TFAR19-related protein (PDSD5 family)